MTSFRPALNSTAICPLRPRALYFHSSSGTSPQGIRLSPSDRKSTSIVLALFTLSHCNKGAAGGAATLRVGSPAGRNARARCFGPPCTTPLQLRQLRSVYRARPYATRRSLTAATARLQSLRDSSPAPLFCSALSRAYWENKPVARLASY